MNRYALFQSRSAPAAWLAAAGIVLAASAIAATAQQDPPVKEMTAAEEEAWATATEAAAEEACAACHPVAEITQTRHTWKEWTDVFDRMAALGLSATEAQLGEVKLYMARYYGAVNINTGSAAEIAVVLGLPAKEASAIVEYRTKNGPFADVAALAKVPGVNEDKIRGQPAAVKFD